MKFIMFEKKFTTFSICILGFFFLFAGCSIYGKNNLFGAYPRSSNYRMFIKYCVFSLKFCDFSELCQFCCSAGFLPVWCLYTHWHQGKTEEGKILKYSKKIQYTPCISLQPIDLSACNFCLLFLFEKLITYACAFDWWIIGPFWLVIT